MGKGSKQRPRSQCLTKDDWDRNWERAFKKIKESKPPEPKKPDKK